MRDNRRVVVLLHMLNWVRGGMERWALDLIGSLPEFEWRVWVAENGTLDRSFLEELTDKAGFFTASQWQQARDGANVFISPGHPNFASFSGGRILVAHGATSYCSGIAQPHQAEADRLVAVSKHAALCFETEYRHLVHVLEHMIQHSSTRCKDRLRRSVRKKWGVKKGQFLIGFAGRIAPDKQPLKSVQAARLINATLVIAGPSSRRKIYIDPRFTRRLGAVADMESFYAAVDCVVMCSRHEGFGLVLTETLAAGVPLVTTPVGFLTDYSMRRRSSATFVSPEVGPRGLAQAIKRASAKHRRPSLSAAARFVRSRFDAEAFAERWRRLIETTLDDRATTSAKNVGPA